MTLVPSVKDELMLAALRLSEPAVVLPSVQGELMRAAARLEASPAAQRLGRRRWQGRPVVGAAVALTGAAALAMVLLLGSPRHTGVAQALPALRGQKHDITRLRRRLDVLVHHDAAFDAARVIPTPLGTGYVMPTKGGDGVCLAVPDKDEGYVQTCASRAEAEAFGIIAVAVPSDGSDAEFVATLPAGPQSTIVTDSRGASRPLPVSKAGVVGALVPLGASVTLTVGQRTRVVPINLRPRCGPLEGSGHLLTARC